MSKKKNGKLTMRGYRPIALQPTLFRKYSKTLQQLAGGLLLMRCGPQYGHVTVRQAHELVWMLSRMVDQANECRIPVFVMDCDVSAAFDHVSDHEIVRAIWEGSPVNREYRNFETVVRLDDIMTPGIRRTRLVPQGDLCAADLFGAALDRFASRIAKLCQDMKR